MSIHPSLRGANNLAGERSVLTRIERIQKLAKDGKVDPQKRSALGLPKVRTKFKIVGKKKEVVPAAGAAAGGATPTAGGAKGAVAAPAALAGKSGAPGKGAGAPAKGAAAPAAKTDKKK